AETGERGATGGAHPVVRTTLRSCSELLRRSCHGFPGCLLCVWTVFRPLGRGTERSRASTGCMTPLPPGQAEASRDASAPSRAELVEDAVDMHTSGTLGNDEPPQVCQLGSPQAAWSWLIPPLGAHLSP